MSETNNPLSSNSGFTLVELLVAMAAGSIMMAVIATSYWVQSKTNRDQQLVVEMQQNLRSGMFFLQRDVMMAGYDDDKNDATDASIITANADTFSYQYVDESGVRIIVTYDLFDSRGDGDMDLSRRTQVEGALATPRAAVAENIEELEFFYTLEDGRQSVNPPILLLPPDNGPEFIRTVGISLLARSSSEAQALENRTYTALSGATVGPYNDGFRRQLITATIKCRNNL